MPNYNKLNETKLIGNEIHKKCQACDEFKALSDFSLQATGFLMRKSLCKACQVIYHRKYYEVNREKLLNQQKEYHVQNKQERNEASKAQYYKRQYNLSEIEVEELKKSGCQICGIMEDLHVDHDHASNKIRGVLCHSCNVGIGHFRDNKELLLKALFYLEKFEEILK